MSVIELIANLTAMVENDTTSVTELKTFDTANQTFGAVYQMPENRTLTISFDFRYNNWTCIYWMNQQTTSTFFLDDKPIDLVTIETCWKHIKSDMGQHLTLKTDEERKMKWIMDRAAEQKLVFERNASNIHIELESMANNMVVKIDYFEKWHPVLNFNLPLDPEEQDVVNALQDVIKCAEVLSGRSYKHLLH